MTLPEWIKEIHILESEKRYEECALLTLRLVESRQTPTSASMFVGISQVYATLSLGQHRETKAVQGE